MSYQGGYGMDEQGRPVYDFLDTPSQEDHTPSVPANFSTEMLHKLQSSLPAGLPTASLPAGLSKLKGKASEALAQWHAIAADTAAAAASLAKINLQHADTFAPPPDAEIDDAMLMAKMHKIREDSRLTCILIFQKHLDEFLDTRSSHGPSSCPTYEEWIRDLHPENARGANTADGHSSAAVDAPSIGMGLASLVATATPPAVPQDLDHRFYLAQSDHLQMWNADPRTGGRRVAGPPGSPQRDRHVSGSSSSSGDDDPAGDLLDFAFITTALPASAAPLPLPPPTDLVMRLQQQHAHLSRLRHALQTQPARPTAAHAAGTARPAAHPPTTPLVLHLQSPAPAAAAADDPFAELGYASLAPALPPPQGASPLPRTLPPPSTLHTAPHPAVSPPPLRVHSAPSAQQPQETTPVFFPPPTTTGPPRQGQFNAAPAPPGHKRDPFSELSIFGKPPRAASPSRAPPPTRPPTAGAPLGAQRTLNLGWFDPLASSGN
jgi:hypothetical protein